MTTLTTDVLTTKDFVQLINAAVNVPSTFGDWVPVKDTKKFNSTPKDGGRVVVLPKYTGSYTVRPIVENQPHVASEYSQSAVEYRLVGSYVHNEITNEALVDAFGNPLIHIAAGQAAALNKDRELNIIKALLEKREDTTNPGTYLTAPIEIGKATIAYDDAVDMKAQVGFNRQGAWFVTSATWAAFMKNADFKADVRAGGGTFTDGRTATVLGSPVFISDLITEVDANVLAIFALPGAMVEYNETNKEVVGGYDGFLGDGVFKLSTKSWRLPVRLDDSKVVVFRKP